MTAKEEWGFGIGPGNFDYVVVNDQLELAYSSLRDFIFSKDSLSVACTNEHSLA
jgi:guanylate kinase